jgi:hypothetical protein
MLPDEQTSPEQFAAYRAMTGAQRWKLAEQLYWSARKIKLAGLRSQHPDWPEERIADELRRLFTGPPDLILRGNSSLKFSNP